jgi:hypothetical protein
MAHYIAGLIDEAATTSEDNKQEAEAKCCEAILHLWKVQGEHGLARRQLASLEQIVSTIASLRDKSPWYFSPDRHGQRNPYCQKALAVDRAARNLISFCLLFAYEGAKDEQSEWLDLARGLPSGTSPLPIIKIMIVTDTLRELSETDKRAELAEEARKGIAEFRSLVDEIEAAVDSVTSRDRPSSDARRRPKKWRRMRKEASS